MWTRSREIARVSGHGLNLVANLASFLEPLNTRMLPNVEKLLVLGRELGFFVNKRVI